MIIGPRTTEAACQIPHWQFRFSIWLKGFSTEIKLDQRRPSQQQRPILSNRSYPPRPSKSSDQGRRNRGTSRPRRALTHQRFNDTAPSFAAIADLIDRARMRARGQVFGAQQFFGPKKTGKPPAVPNLPLIPLAVLPYLSVERLMEFRQTAPGTAATLDSRKTTAANETKNPNANQIIWR
jgi:hypothetical protein